MKLLSESAIPRIFLVMWSSSMKCDQTVSARGGGGENSKWSLHSLLGEQVSWQGWLHTHIHTEHLADPKFWANWQKLPQDNNSKWHDRAVQLTYSELKGKKITLKFCSPCFTFICKPWAKLAVGPHLLIIIIGIFLGVSKQPLEIHCMCVSEGNGEKQMVKKRKKDKVEWSWD